MSTKIFDSIQTLGGSGDDVYLGGSSAGANMASFTLFLLWIFDRVRNSDAQDFAN